MLLEIVSKNTVSKFEGDKEKFLRKFEQLYRLPILRPSLNLIVTKCKKSEANFVVQPLKNWDRCVGHCQTKGFFGKMGDMFSRKLTHEIVIKTIESDIIMHEIAHAIEKTSGIDLNADFRKVLGLDMNGRVSSHLQVAPAVESVMKNELKSYKIHNVMEELFARYFELLAMSYEVGGFSRYQFKYENIVDYFINTTKWVEEYFNPLILKMIDGEVSKASEELVKNLKPYEKKWSEDVKQTHYSTNPEGVKNWTSGTKSTSRWSNIGEAFTAIQQDKKDRIEN